MLFAVYDTETSGLPFHEQALLSQQPRIIEFGGIITDGVHILDQLEFICNPGIAIEPIITQITGLTNEDLKDKYPFKHYVSDLTEYFEQADAYVAHNAAFDRHMVQFDLQRLGKDLPDVKFPALGICTVEQTFHQYGKRMKLIELYTEFCGEYVQKHRAIDDVMCLFEVAKRIGLFEALQEAA